MGKDLSRLFEQGNDDDLCSEVFGRISDAHNNDVDAARLSEEERVVWLVLGATGVIENGGFWYLFENQTKGDPYFALTARAFEQIGCTEAAEAFRRTLALFPDSKPPRNIRTRLKLYNSRIESRLTEMDVQFMEAHKSIIRSLGAYIRAHRAAFKHLVASSNWNAQQRPELREKGATGDL